MFISNLVRFLLARMTDQTTTTAQRNASYARQVEALEQVAVPHFEQRYSDQWPRPIAQIIPGKMK